METRVYKEKMPTSRPRGSSDEIYKVKNTCKIKMPKKFEKTNQINFGCLELPVFGLG